jgi:molybdopterin converting factor small subunit
MSIAIHLHPFLYNLIEDKEIIQTTGSTVGECIDQLIAQYPVLRKYIFYKNRELQTNIAIYVNLKNIRLNELEWPVTDGDKIYLMMIVAGG